ncbi:phosphomannomutase/phosphoglucomutase [Helicobacter canadensis]|uniref:Phosphomannomutase n=1 Tax=Helicobacter canadensis MIT 98-5491 TaxID=537970 RepID=C5ZWJ7_9HELI|nr:phosphomannomutase/phosphoglucomutase [Helicobacter canadensis]EES89515.1 phosphomannomutase [Helicobacter canadensis MIT 98-5491]EFR48306.1 putative phosphomannomutase/phosphoglucomutase [Helicobacter canadensis MIT 98-5491]STO99553.1 phosphohexosemutase [Helicobacter canadensis]
MEKLTIFREYDIRGIYNQDLTQDNVIKIGFLLGEELKKRGGKTLGVGYDARVHSPIIFDWLCSGIGASGITTYNLGQIPTPVGYFALYTDFNGLSLDGSIIITGSHNPPQYNGFKITLLKQPFFGEDIYKLEQDFYSLQTPKVKIETPQKLNALEKYIDFLSQEFQHLKGLNIPINLDCGNGIAGVGIVEILKKLELKFEGLYLNPDGTFPNHHPDPSEEKNLEDLKKLVAKKGGIGFAFDGDGDRLALIKGDKVYKGDELAIIFAQKIPNPIIIGEVKCSLNMFESINKIGKAIMYKTGHSNLKIKLKETNAHLAFEVSGHIFFNDRYFGFDDATYAALRVLELIKEDGLEFDKILQTLPKLYSTDEMKIPTTEEKKFQIIQQLKETLKNPPKDFPEIVEIIDIDGLRVIFKEGWGLIRASNTTPMLVTRFEAKNELAKEIYQNALLGLLKKDL